MKAPRIISDLTDGLFEWVLFTLVVWLVAWLVVLLIGVAFLKIMNWVTAIFVALVLSQLFLLYALSDSRSRGLKIRGIVTAIIGVTLCVAFWQSMPAWESMLVADFAPKSDSVEKIETPGKQGKGKIIVFYRDDTWLGKKRRVLLSSSNSTYVDDKWPTSKDAANISYVVDIVRGKSTLGGSWVYRDTRQEAPNPQEEVAMVRVFNAENGELIDSKRFSLTTSTDGTTKGKKAKIDEIHTWIRSVLTERGVRY